MSTPLPPANVFEFSKEVKSLTAGEKYEEALVFFKLHYQKFSKDAISNNPYLIGAVIKALYKSGKICQAFKFLELYNVKISESSNKLLIQPYAWLIYASLKSELNQDEEIVEEADFLEDEIEDENVNLTNLHHETTLSPAHARAKKIIMLLLTMKDDYSYAPMSRIWNLILKQEKIKPRPNWGFVIEWCDMLDPEYLSLECRTIKVKRKGVLKDMELASDKENWYAYKTKALLKLNRFEECFELSHKALESFEKFHYSNDIWFARRIALSKKQMGATTEAINLLEKILQKKNEWFIQKELAELHHHKGDSNKAISLAIAAMLNHGDLAYKVELISFIAKLLKEAGNIEMSYKHLALQRLIRIKEEWNVSSTLISDLKAYNQPVIEVKDFDRLLSELKSFWKNGSKSNEKSDDPKNLQYRIMGRISKILNNNESGMNGFISYGAKSDVYFKLHPNDELRHKLQLGTLIEFDYIPATEGRKDKAIHLEIVKAL